MEAQASLARSPYDDDAIPGLEGGECTPASRSLPKVEKKEERDGRYVSQFENQARRGGDEIGEGRGKRPPALYQEGIYIWERRNGSTRGFRRKKTRDLFRLCHTYCITPCEFRMWLYEGKFPFPPPFPPPPLKWKVPAPAPSVPTSRNEKRGRKRRGISAGGGCDSLR